MMSRCLRETSQVMRDQTTSLSGFAAVVGTCRATLTTLGTEAFLRVKRRKLRPVVSETLLVHDWETVDHVHSPGERRIYPAYGFKNICMILE
jgi:hypothetical protein